MNKIKLKFLNKVNNFKWAILNRTTRRYHLLCLSQPKDKDGTYDEYHVGWIDADKQMVFAMFNILCNFVEKELENDFSQFSLELGHQNEIQAIYKYCKIDRPKLQEELREIEQIPYSQRKQVQYVNFLDKMERLETEMLIRLINIRTLMWT